MLRTGTLLPTSVGSPDRCRLNQPSATGATRKLAGDDGPTGTLAWLASGGRRDYAQPAYRLLDNAGLALLGKLVQKQIRPMRTSVMQSNNRRQAAAVPAQRLVRELALTRAPNGIGGVHAMPDL